jgi:hypothetical protein
MLTLTNSFFIVTTTSLGSFMTSEIEPFASELLLLRIFKISVPTPDGKKIRTRSRQAHLSL